jgi:replicative DNA helicase
LIGIDYLQLIKGVNSRQENRQHEIAQISFGIKSIAKELNIPVVVLAQLNRDIEREKARKPRLSDLRESGAIEQDGDLIGMLYCPDEEAEMRDFSAVMPTNLLVAKQRNGPTGDVRLTFFKQFTRFESAAKISNSDMPLPYSDI